MLSITDLPIPGYHRVVEAKDPESGLHCFIAIHNLALGPAALGGTRFYPYNSREEALNDALRLAKGMTYKSAIVQDGFGGGKSVIIGDPKKDKNEKVLLSFGDLLNSLKGLYVAAEDMGTNPADMMTIRKRSPFVAALPTDKSSGDPSRFTAWGVFRGIQAVLETLEGHHSFRGKTIAIEGVGNVGSHIAYNLFWAGANLIICDRDAARAHDVALLYGAKVVALDEIFDVPCDIFSPCAVGGILNSKTIPRLKCKAIAGSANNQLLTPEDGQALLDRGILYAPDYVINGGGIINATMEFDHGGYNANRARDRVDRIYETLMEIFAKAKKEHKPTHAVADEMAEYNILHGIGKRTTPLRFAS